MTIPTHFHNFKKPLIIGIGVAIVLLGVLGFILFRLTLPSCGGANQKACQTEVSGMYHGCKPPAVSNGMIGEEMRCELCASDMVYSGSGGCVLCGTLHEKICPSDTYGATAGCRRPLSNKDGVCEVCPPTMKYDNGSGACLIIE